MFKIWCPIVKLGKEKTFLRIFFFEIFVGFWAKQFREVGWKTWDRVLLAAFYWSRNSTKFGDLAKFFSPRLTKLHLTCSEKLFGGNFWFERKIFLFKISSFVGKTATGLLKLRSTRQEVILAKNVLFSKKINGTFFSRRWLKHSLTLGVFFLLLVCHFPFSITKKNVSGEKIFFSWNWFNNFFDRFWWYKFFTLVNTSNFGVQWKIWAKIFFQKFVFWSECANLTRTILVVWLENLRQGCLSYILLSQWNIF